ncbi:PREDICTED: uncharacterized protein LOC109476669 isoform X3 [Branchiostoma belcheri]|uniref:Uncharacterized protein LOC109476669 isoform X3 n=1 Tax=Branchiostoma belcheri TaxID=7741 RepID=A0A6P4Z979_BRABE|nr:PREDICTED: uncharacterized protein LOC109476669 isoform X3 [Branchiostoma belcheri]
MDDACPKKVGSKRKRQRQYCGHCNQELGNTAYYLHKKQFFKDGVWRQAALFGGSKGPTDTVDNGASCPIATQEHGEGDFYTEDTLDDDGLEPPDTSSAENDGFDVGEGETNGWLEDEDLRLFLSDTGSDTSSDQGDACYEERDIREDVDDQEEPEIWSGEAPTGEEFVAVDNSATGESDTPGGIEVQPPNEESYIAKVFLVGCTADMQAKALLINMKQHNGKCGCPKCLQEGTHAGHKQQYPFQTANPKGPKRTHEEARAHAEAALASSKDVFGIKGASWLTTIPHFDIIEGMAIDYMQGTLLGVTKRLIHFWFFDKNGEWYCGESKLAVDNMLESIKPPMEVHRMPRSISSHLPHWKADASCLHHTEIPRGHQRVLSAWNSSPGLHPQDMEAEKPGRNIWLYSDR